MQPAMSTTVATFNLGGSGLTAPLTAEQQAALVAAVNGSLQNVPGIQNISIGNVTVRTAI